MEEGHTLRTTRLAVLLLGITAALVACGDDDRRDGSGDDDRSIVLYSGRDEELLAPIIERFTEQTGIEVEVRYAGSAELAAQILEEGDRTPADVFYSQEVGAVGALAKADLLDDLPAETVALADTRFRPASGTEWVGVTARARVIVYNPDRLAELGVPVPDEVTDLTDEAYRGEVAIVPGNAGFQAFVTAFRVAEGEDAARRWLVDVLANDADASFEKNGEVLEAVNDGTIAVGLINHYYWARHENRDQLVARLVFPTGDDPGGLVNATAIGVTAGNGDDADALALVDHLLSVEGQETFVRETWEYPVVDGVDDPPGLPPLTELSGPDLDLTDLDSLEETQALLVDVGLIS
ncbi:MAG: extracellular solute-binding protein [Actinobacteria bacterium]|nr:extracellular solute-binding protein [Actinomycetota bacterium]